ncbi:MAG: TIGR03557 family F420-dependent LLM class oxidoreductase, partial [Terriglobales bacterium]
PRRTMLKSAAVLGASALTGGMPTMSFGQSGGGSAQQNTRGLRKGMFAFMLGHEQFTVPQLVEFGVAAEDAGFDMLATSDHLQPWQTNEGHSGMAWVTMAALGARTKRAWMGTTVTCPTFRYTPPVVAEGFASLSLLYPGRIFLGVGSGEALNEEAGTGQWPKWPERSERLVEATDLIRKLWGGQQVQHQGKYYQANMKLYDPPAAPIPLLMAGNGPKAMRRCGQYGDGLITDPQTWKQHKSEWEAGARAAGKDPSKMPVLLEAFVTVGDQNEARKAAELWRFLPKAFKKYYNIRDPQEIQNEAEREIAIDQLISEWAIGTHPNIHIKKVQELFDSGAWIVNIHSGQADQKKVINFYGKEVLPKVRQTAKAA